MKKVKEIEKVKLHEIGLLIKVVLLDYSPEDNKELAELISEHFNVECTEEDINKYEMHFIHEDYERINREVEYGTYGI